MDERIIHHDRCKDVKKWLQIITFYQLEINLVQIPFLKFLQLTTSQKDHGNYVFGFSTILK